MPADSDPAASPTIDRKAIDPDACRILFRLEEFGHRAYLVGGCVRDLLVGGAPKDFDISTDARPRQIRRIFRNSRVIGRRFRLVHVRFGPRIFEVSTFRAPPAEADQGDDPYITRDNVFGTEEQDAVRRDFTINGLFYDVSRRRVIDYVGGLRDLGQRCVRTIGDSLLRLREDPVRILRAMRFAARLRFELDPELTAAMFEVREDLSRSPPPRVLEELYKMLSSHGAARCFELFEELGAREILLPEVHNPPERLRRALTELEVRTDGRRDGVPQGMLLATLTGPWVLSVLKDVQTDDREAAVQELLFPIARRFVVARRDVGMARQCLAAQWSLRHPPHGGRSRRLTYLEIFRPALELRRILGPLDDDDEQAAETLAAWEEHGRHAARPRDPEGQQPRRRGRRRRRGGRRRGRGGKDLSGPASDARPGPCPPAPSNSS